MNSKSVRMCVQLQIDEPWDFHIPGKGNVLEGIVEGVCEGPPQEHWEGKYLLISLAKRFNWKGATVKQLLVSPRYEGDTIKDILDGKNVIVGIARIRPHVSLKPVEAFTPQQVEYFAIGSIQRKT